VAGIAARHGVRVLFAAKSFPAREVVELAAARLGGLDLAGPEERALGVRAAHVSITDPGLDAAGLRALAAERLSITCETVAQVEAARRARPDAAIALRVSMSAVVPGDDAIGALQAGDGHRRSRFGVDGVDDWRALRELAAAARGAPIGLHVHSAGVVPASAARWAAIARGLVEVAARCELAPAFVDLGGSWHGVGGTDAELELSIAAVRAAVPSAIDVVIEPGRLFTRGAGYAVGEVLAARALADRALCVVSLSRLAHLRWSPVELVARPPRAGTGGKVTFAGATCFEDDVIGDWTLASAPVVGQRVMWAGVSGYSAAWNRAFSGVPAAHVRFTK
jgi:diaminopimelate decarboxylase